MSAQRVATAVFLSSCVISLSSCTAPKSASAPPLAGPRPGWVDKPKTDDALYLYRVGHAAAFPTAVEARRAAYHDALQQVAEWLRREANLTPDTPVRIHGVAIEPGCVYTEPQQTGFASWVQISYPTSSKTNAIDRPK